MQVIRDCYCIDLKTITIVRQLVVVKIANSFNIFKSVYTNFQELQNKAQFTCLSILAHEIKQ